MVCLEQMYIIFENFTDNYYYQDCNGLIVTQQSLNEEHFQHFYFLVVWLSVLPNNFIVSGVKSSR